MGGLVLFCLASIRETIAFSDGKKPTETVNKLEKETSNLSGYPGGAGEVAVSVTHPFTYCIIMCLY